MYTPNMYSFYWIIGTSLAN